MASTASMKSAKTGFIGVLGGARHVLARECTPEANALLWERKRVIDRRRKSIRSISIVEDDVNGAATVRPPFDPQEFARQSERETLPPPVATTSDAPDVVSGTMEVFWPVEATTVPTLAVAKEDLEWFELPPMARKLLEHVDGTTPIEEICARSGVSLLDASALFDELAREGIVLTV